jgi:hypothetical protein
VRPIYWLSITPAVGVLKLKYFYAISAHRVKETRETAWTLNSVNGGGVGLENPPEYIDKKSAKFYTAYVDYYMC